MLGALTAACYDSHARGLGRRLLGLWLTADELAVADCEPEGAHLVRQVGWIYFLAVAPSPDG